MIKYRTGDIINDFCCKNASVLILQQNNCTATKINKNSFAYQLYNKLSYSNPYENRRNSAPYRNLAIQQDRPTPGSIEIMYKDEKHPIVCCLFAQYKMGSHNSKYYMNARYIDATYLNSKDDPESRIKYFRMCLVNVLNLFDNDNKNQLCKNVKKIIFPRKIGCNSAGGDWKLYKKEIKIFAKKLNDITLNRKKICIYIIKYKHGINKD